MKDKTLAEKAITEEYSLKQVIQAGINRESLKSNTEAMQSKTAIALNRVGYTSSGEDKLEGWNIEPR